MIRRLLPHPIMTLLLTLLWLVFNQSAGLGHILLGGAVAIGVTLVASVFITETVRVRNPHKLIKLAWVVAVDVVRSNLAVMSILFRPKAMPAAGFIEMELELTNTFGLAVLACIITATPGSAWLEYDQTRSVVLIHVFDLVDADEWSNTIKVRYESLLLEIFQ